MKIISYNVNGIRAALTKNFTEWLQAEDPDILCLQETKAQPDQIDTMLFAEMGYTSFLHSADKKGYSGVAILQPKMFEGLAAGKRPLAPLLKQAMLDHKISASKMQGVWVDVGTPERLNLLDQQIKQGMYA